MKNYTFALLLALSPSLGMADESSLTAPGSEGHTHVDLQAFLDARLDSCRKVVADLNRVRDVEVLEDCWDFYWHGGDREDEIHGYDRILQIGERIVVLEPVQETTYADLAWLYWSRWKETKEDPAAYPQQKKYLDKLQLLLQKGQRVRANMRNFVFVSDTAFTIYLMQADLPQLRPTMVNLWVRALQIADLKDPDQKQRCVNVSKQLGYHYYKTENNKAKALEYFKYAVKLQPDNEGAKRMVEKIERELAEETP